METEEEKEPEEEEPEEEEPEEASTEDKRKGADETNQHRRRARNRPLDRLTTRTDIALSSKEENQYLYSS